MGGVKTLPGKARRVLAAAAAAAVACAWVWVATLPVFAWGPAGLSAYMMLPGVGLLAADAKARSSWWWVAYTWAAAFATMNGMFLPVAAAGYWIMFVCSRTQDRP